MIYTFVFSFLVCFQSLYASEITRLYYVESPEPSMDLSGRKFCMKEVHDELCSREIPLTKAASEQALPHTPNILGAAWTVVYNSGKTHTNYLCDGEGKPLFFCSNASLEVREDEATKKDSSTLFVTCLKAEQVQDRLRTVAQTTSQNCSDLYLSGMRRILDEVTDRTQDCGHTEPKLIAHLMDSVVQQVQSGNFEEMFEKEKEISYIVLNLHSYLYPCLTCKDLLIHFGWYMNQILEYKKISFRCIG